MYLKLLTLIVILNGSYFTVIFTENPSKIPLGIRTLKPLRKIKNKSLNSTSYIVNLKVINVLILQEN